MKYDVFISYSRKDSNIADEICDALKAKGFSFFIDKSGISGGENFRIVIGEAIENSSVFLFLGSKNAYASREVRKELDWALDFIYESMGRMIIIPYLIDDEAVPKDIKMDIKRLNIRNIHEHPIEPVLLSDIQTALEKLAPKSSGLDQMRLKDVIGAIKSTSSDKSYVIGLLTAMGDYSSRCYGEGYRPIVAKEYYKTALELAEKHSGEATDEVRDIAKLNEVLGDIEGECSNFSIAEEHYSQAVQSYYSLMGNSPRPMILRSYIDSLFKLSKTRLSLKEYDLAKEGGMKARDFLAGFRPDSMGSRRWLSGIVPKICSLMLAIHQEKGDVSDVGTIYDEFLSIFQGKKEYQDALNELANIAMKNEHWEKAEEYLVMATSSLDDKIKMTEILMDLARTYEAQGKRKQTAEVYDRCFKLLLENDSSEYSRQNTDVVWQTTRFYDECHRYDEVDEYFQTVLAKYRVDSFGKQPSSQQCCFHEMYADWLFQHKRYSEALSNLNQGLHMLQSPGIVPRPHFLRIKFSTMISRILFVTGLDKDARSLLDKALESDKETLISSGYDSINRLYEMTQMLESVHFDAGVSLIKEFIIDNFTSLSEMDERFNTDLGWTLMLLGEFEHARKPLEKALTQAQEGANKANAQNNLGRLYIHIGRFDEAEELLSAAREYLESNRELDSDNLRGLAENQSYKGLLQMEKGELESAIVWFEKSLENYYSCQKDYGRSIDSSIDQVSQWLEKAKSSL